VPAVGQKALEPRFSFRRRVRPGDADGVEAERMRLRDERGLDLPGL